jgi:hypothetical protein
MPPAAAIAERPSPDEGGNQHALREALSMQSACNRGATLTIEGLMKEAISMQSRSDPHHRGPESPMRAPPSPDPPRRPLE